MLAFVIKPSCVKLIPYSGFVSGNYILGTSFIKRIYYFNFNMNIFFTDFKHESVHSLKIMATKIRFDENVIGKFKVITIYISQHAII